MISKKAEIFNENYDILKETIINKISSKHLQESLIRSIACYTEYKFKNVNENTDTDALLEDINEVYCAIYDTLRENSTLSNKIDKSISLLSEGMDEKTNGERYNVDMNPDNAGPDGMQNKSGITTHYINIGGSNNKDSKYTTIATPNTNFHSVIDHEVVPIPKADGSYTNGKSTDPKAGTVNASLETNKTENNTQQKGNSWHFGHDEPMTNARHNRIDDLFVKLGIPLNYNSPVDDLNDPFGHNLKNNDNKPINGTNTTTATNIKPINTNTTPTDNKQQLLNTSGGLSVNNSSNGSNTQQNLASNVSDTGDDSRYFPRVGSEYSYPDPSEKAQHLSSQYSLVTGNKNMDDVMKKFEADKEKYLVVQNPLTGKYEDGTVGKYKNGNTNINDGQQIQTKSIEGKELNVYKIPGTNYYQPHIKIPTAKENFDYRKVNNNSLKGIEGYASIDDYVKKNLNTDPNIRVINDTGNNNIRMAKQSTPIISQNKNIFGDGEKISINNDPNNKIVGNNSKMVATGNTKIGNQVS